MIDWPLPEQSDELPAEIEGIDWQDAYAALGYLTCPWRLRVGICQSGCSSEPACETGEPEDGWAAEVRRAVEGTTVRADGRAMCPRCNKSWDEHPLAYPDVSLRRACTGDLVKL